MRFAHWVLSSTLGASLFLAAGAARADGFFVTVTGPQGALGPRTAGVSFEDDTSAGAGGQVKASYKATVPWGAATTPLLQALFSNQGNLGVLFELTQPNAQGVEQVYLTVKLTDVQLGDIATSLANSSSAVDVTFLSPKPAVVAAVTAPAAKPTDAPKAAATPLRVPTIALQSAARVNMLKAGAGAVNVNDANAAFPNFPTEVAGQTGQVHLTALSLAVGSVHTTTGLSTGKIKLTPVLLTKAPGAATASLQQALANKKLLPSVEVDLVDKTAVGTASVRARIKLGNVQIADDKTQVSGGASSEQVTLKFEKIEIQDPSGQKATYDSKTATTSSQNSWSTPVQ
jgi:type VI protein secretion system component Hcp